MGVVHAAWDEELHRTVALKLARDRSADPTRLVREARGLARVVHPNVVTLHDVGVASGRVYSVMELIEGTTLRGWLAARPRTWTEILAIAIEIGRGLAAVHAHGLVHRDVKPDNVLIGGDGRVALADFGLVSAEGTRRDAVALGCAERDETDHSATAGTPAYMAPEVLRGGEATAAADQYALAVVAWEALFGHRPFEGRDLFTQLEAAERGVPRGRGRKVPRALVRVLGRALSPAPSDRFESVARLVDELAAIERRRPHVRAGRWLAAASLFVSITHAVAPSWIPSIGHVHACSRPPPTRGDAR
jgi:serine/threonine protein kinase